MERAIESVRAQGTFDVEHIVVDGGSTDGTIEVLKRHKSVRVISESDSNLYEALNKGIRAASGEIVGLLNADDRLAPGALCAVVELFKQRHEVGIVAGAADIVRRDGEREVRRRFDDERLVRLRERNAIAGVTLTNARFFRRVVLDSLGNFDERFPIVSDREFMLRATVADIAVVTTRKVLYEYVAHSGSLTFACTGRSMVLAEAFLNLAETRLADPPMPLLFVAFRRWHAWAAGYLIMLELLRGRLGVAFSRAVRAFGIDRFWLVRFLPVLVMHIFEIRLRRGVLVNANGDDTRTSLRCADASGIEVT